MKTLTAGLNTEQCETFRAQGYLVLPGRASRGRLAELQQVAREELAARRPPLEFESEADYPGLPERVAREGSVVRRLLQAYDRHPLFAAWATSAALVACLRSLLGPDLCLVRNHHNCLMTKHPAGGSRTGWHRDTRYWYFERPELVNAWLALDAERPVNGGLRVIPGSHVLHIEPDRFDAALFLRDEPRNRDLIAYARPLELEPGDVLLFHSHLLHAAGNNRSRHVKHALVFTYRARDNAPLPETRSSRLPDVVLDR